MFWLRKIKPLVVLQKRINDHEDERGCLETTEVHSQLIKTECFYVENDRSAMITSVNPHQILAYAA